MASRNNDKINCPTNVTKPASYAGFLYTINELGVVTRRDATTKYFPQARADRGATSRSASDNNDTHNISALLQYGLIEFVDSKNDKLQVSYLGKRLLEVFVRDDNGKVVLRKNSEYTYNSILIDCLMSWKDNSGKIVIQPGMLLLKLLSDTRIDKYLSECDWAYTCSKSSYRNDGDYEKLVREILEFRKSGLNIPLGNAYAFLVSFSSSWGIFNKNTVDNQNRWVLSEMTQRNLELKAEEYDLLINSKDSIIVKKENKLIKKKSIKPFMVPMSYELNDDITNLEMERVTIESQNILVGDKVLFVDEALERIRLYNVYLIENMQQYEKVYDIDIIKREKVNRAKETEIIKQLKEDDDANN